MVASNPARVMTNPETHQPSIGTLLRDLRDETTTLLRQEVALAKAELKENTSRMTSHALQIAIGGFVSYAGVIVLLIGLGMHGFRTTAIDAALAGSTCPLERGRS